MPSLHRLVFAVALASVFVLIEFPATAQIKSVATTPTASASNLTTVAQMEANGNFQIVPVPVVLDYYERLAGVRLIRESGLERVPPVSINASGLAKDEALKLVVSTLLLDNVAIISLDDHTQKAVSIGITKNPSSEGVRFFANEADLPSDDEIVTYYMPLNHIGGQEAADIFARVSPCHVYGSYAPAPSANGIVLTENCSVVRKLIALQPQIDRLRHTDASPPGHRPPPYCGGWVGGLVSGVVIFVAGYFYGRWRLRKKLAAATR